MSKREEIDINTRIMHLFKRCHSIIHSRMAGGRTSQTEILRIINKYGPMTQKDLQKYLDIRQASLSEILSKMEESGLIVKIKTEKDRRITFVELTDEGRNLTLEKREKHRKERADILSCFDDDEKECLISLLDKLYEHLKESEENK